jgi:hypothetical protein
MSQNILRFHGGPRLRAGLALPGPTASPPEASRDHDNHAV